MAEVERSGDSNFKRISWVEPKPLHKRRRGCSKRRSILPGVIKILLFKRKSDGFRR